MWIWDEEHCAQKKNVFDPGKLSEKQPQGLHSPNEKFQGLPVPPLPSSPLNQKNKQICLL